MTTFFTLAYSGSAQSLQADVLARTMPSPGASQSRSARAASPWAVRHQNGARVKWSNVAVASAPST